MYEFLILAQLSRRPMHGYLIAKILGDILGPFRRMQWGALYPLLGRLERDGLVVASDMVGDDGRCRKVYAITDAGRDRLHRSLMDTEKHLGDYDTLFALKVSLFSHLTPEERTRLARHYAVHAQHNIDHLAREREDFSCGDSSRSDRSLAPEEIEDIRAVIDHRLEYWEAERTWAEALMEQHRHKEAM